MKGKNSHTAQSVITKKEYEELEKIADKQSRSVSDLLALVIREFLGNKRKKLP